MLTWKSTLEAKGLKVSVSKTTVTFGGKCKRLQQGTLNIHVEFAVRVSVVTESCAQLVANGYIGLNDVVALKEVWERFRILSAVYVRPALLSKMYLGLCIGNDTSFERVETFCYFGDMLSSDGGCVSEG